MQHDRVNTFGGHSPGPCADLRRLGIVSKMYMRLGILSAGGEVQKASDNVLSVN